MPPPLTLPQALLLPPRLVPPPLTLPQTLRLNGHVGRPRTAASEAFVRSPQLVVFTQQPGSNCTLCAAAIGAAGLLSDVINVSYATCPSTIDPPPPRPSMRQSFNDKDADPRRATEGAAAEGATAEGGGAEGAAEGAARRGSAAAPMPWLSWEPEYFLPEAEPEPESEQGSAAVVHAGAGEAAKPVRDRRTKHAILASSPCAHLASATLMLLALACPTHRPMHLPSTAPGPSSLVDPRQLLLGSRVGSRSTISQASLQQSS